MGRARTSVGWATGIIAAGLSLAAGSGARADQQYDLKLNVAPDQQWSFQQTSTMTLNVTVGNAGGQQFQQATDQKRTGTVTVLSVKDGAPSALRVAFGPDCSQSSTQNGQSQGQPFPLTGKTVVVRKDDLGIIQIDGAAIPGSDQATTNELTNMLTPDRSMYPPHPVSVGDDWAGDAGALSKQLGLGPNDSVSVHCKLKDVQPVNGRSTADLSVNIVGTKTENGVTTKMTLDGTAQTDVATGQTIQADLAGRMDVSGQANTPQGQQPVQGDGKLELHQTVRPLAGFAPSPAVSGTGGNPLAPAPGGTDNPLAPAPDAARFTGTFKGDRLTVQFDPAAAGVSGSITMGDRKFPAIARVDGDRLVGTFDANGNKFAFVATADGQTLQLTTGQSRYTLQKDAPANPLDMGGGAAPAPVNPLGR